MPPSWGCGPSWPSPPSGAGIAARGAGLGSPGVRYREKRKPLGKEPREAERFLHHRPRHGTPGSWRSPAAALGDGKGFPGRRRRFDAQPLASQLWGPRQGSLSGVLPVPFSCSGSWGHRSKAGQVGAEREGGPGPGSMQGRGSLPRMTPPPPAHISQSLQILLARRTPLNPASARGPAKPYSGTPESRGALRSCWALFAGRDGIQEAVRKG